MANPAIVEGLRRLDLFPARGRVRRVRSGEIEADGPDMPVGAHCLIGNSAGGVPLLRAQVLSVSEQGILLSPFGGVDRLRVGTGCRPRRVAMAGSRATPLPGAR